MFVRNLREALSQVIVVEEYSTPLAKKAVALTCYGIASANDLPLGQPRLCSLGTQLDGHGWHFLTQSTTLYGKKIVRLRIALGLLMSPIIEAAERINSYVPGG
ncbi:hypothetical protein S245_016557 [Arachis hypogaea]